MHRLETAVTTADELTAVTQAIKFKYDDGKTSLSWPVGDSVDPALYVIFPLADSKKRKPRNHKSPRKNIDSVFTHVPTHVLFSSAEANSRAI